MFTTEDTESTEKSGTYESRRTKRENRNAKTEGSAKTIRLRHDPSTPRPDAPESGAKKRSGRSGRDDGLCVRRKLEKRVEEWEVSAWGFAGEWEMGLRLKSAGCAIEWEVG